MTPRPPRLLSALLAVVLMASVGHVTARTAAAVDGQAFVTLANAKRALESKEPVAYSALLEQISDERARHMASAGVLEHDMAYVAQRLDQAGVCYSGYGEIIAWSSASSIDPVGVIELWWASSGHHKIMVGDYNAAGGSHATSSAGTYSIMVFVKFCSSPPVSDGATTDITRLAGADRYATAAAISRTRFEGGASTVYVATGENFPDALAAAAAAGHNSAPVLLTRASSLPDATRYEIARLHPSRIVVVGGTAAVGSAVLNALMAYAPTQRLSGSSRYATAAAVSKATFTADSAVVYVATGESFPDTLAGGALAGRDGGPVLLVQRSGIPDATRAELARLRPNAIVVLGGTGAVSATVASQLKGYTTSGTLFRLSGSDRYGTAVAASRASYRNGSTAAFVATGTTFADGLAGGPVAALVPGPVLLVEPNALPSSVAAELQRLGPDDVFILGSTGAVSNAVVSQINAILP